MPDRPPKTVVKGEEPAVVIPVLIDYLRSLGERGIIKANWIEDVYSEVIKGVINDDLKDLSWIEQLTECLLKQFNSLANVDPRLRGYVFSYEPGEGWGWRRQ